ERATIERLMASDALRGHTRPLAALSADMRDVYGATHWAVAGAPPAYHTPDEDVYLPGRNIILLAKAAVLCAAAGLDRIVIGTLAHNPFPDATPEFRSATARALSLGLAHTLEVEAPYAGMEKAEVIRRCVALGVPLELTISCMNPVVVARADGPFARHCGECSKCRERRDAFVEAGVADSTDYASVRFTGRSPAAG